MVKRGTPVDGWVPITRRDVDLLDDRDLAAWVRLNALADAVWPANAPIPRSVDDGVLARLGSRLWVVDGAQFRIPELDERRSANAIKASTAANRRWAAERAKRPKPADTPRNASSNTPRNASSIPKRSSRRNANQNQNQNQNQTVSRTTTARARDDVVGPFGVENGRLARVVDVTAK